MTAIDERLAISDLHTMLAELRPLREPDSLLMTHQICEKIRAAVEPMLVAKAEVPGYRLYGMEMRVYPAGTIVYDMKTGTRAVIDDTNVLSVIYHDVMVVVPPSAMLAAAGGRDE